MGLDSEFRAESSATLGEETGTVIRSATCGVMKHGKAVYNFIILNLLLFSSNSFVSEKLI